MTFNHGVVGSIPAARIASQRRNTFHIVSLVTTKNDA